MNLQICGRYPLGGANHCGRRWQTGQRAERLRNVNLIALIFDLLDSAVEKSTDFVLGNARHQALAVDEAEKRLTLDRVYPTIGERHEGAGRYQRP